MVPMNTAKSRLAILSNKTSKGAVRRICESLIEMADSIPDQNLSQIALDKLSPYGSDIAVKSFVSNESRLLSLLDMGIKKSADKILGESSISKYPHLKGPIDQFRRLSESNPDYLIIENYLNVLKPILWEPVVKGEFEILESRKNNLSEDILVRTSIDVIRASRNNFIYGSLIEKLENYVMDRTSGSRKMIIQELDRYRFDTNINKLANNLRLIENSLGGFNMLSNTTKCSVKPSVGFVDIKESVDYILLDGSFYAKKNNRIIAIRESDAQKYSPSLFAINNISKSRNISIQGEKVVMLMGKDTVKLNENGTIELNNQEITREDLKHKAAITSIIDPNYSRTLNDVLTIHENIGKMMEIDFAKTISSNIYEGVKINVIKGDKYVVNYVNPAMNENKTLNFTKANQLKNFVWDTFSYDISESFVEVLSKENRQLNEMKSASNSLFNEIVSVENELKKLAIEKQRDESVRESKTINSLEDSLKEHLRDLKRKYSVISKKLNEAASSVPIPSVGDTVKVRAKGTGTVLSVDGVDNRFIVLLNSGETVQCISKDLDVVESMIKRSTTASPEVNLSMIQGSNAKPFGKHSEIKKSIKESYNMNEDIDDYDDVISISMDDVKGMTLDPSNIVKHDEFGSAYDEDIRFFDEMSSRGQEDYYPDVDEDEDMEEVEDMQIEETPEEELEENAMYDDSEWDESDYEEEYLSTPDEEDVESWSEEMDDDFEDDFEDDFDDEDDDEFGIYGSEFDDDFEQSHTDQYSGPEDEIDLRHGGAQFYSGSKFGAGNESIQSDELEIEKGLEDDLHHYDEESKTHPGYGSRQAHIDVDSLDDDDFDEEDLTIQFEENEEDDELYGSYGGAVEES
jgi:hypothetical protein